MRHKHQVTLVSDSTGETLNRIFLTLKAQFSNFTYEKKEYMFVRTKDEIEKL
jgi:regulator of PEP synthase PpsR (kinase-PPPase family)